MKRLYLIPFLVLFLCGCATYSIQKEKDGFAVARYKKVIPEYTQGADNSFPQKGLAQERFNRRRKTVEDYYKKMGFIDNRFKQVFMEPPLVFMQFIAGVFRMPFIMVSDYRYNRNPQYKERMDKIDDEKYEAEKARIKGLKDSLSLYIQEDLAKEVPGQVAQEIKPIPEAKPAELPAVVPMPALKETVKPKVVKAKPQKIKPLITLQNPQASIIAKPQSGPSPLKVIFSGNKSKSPNGRIVSYEWDFGDGDKSNKPNPSNTYWSTIYGAREFIVTLTVTDSKGMKSSSSVTISVVNN
ncbi:MAG: PKD domain-containing protein [Candidatus Omnitrophica bacterium]|nr:PKD domain-containing protein [Candidatus Omnitrophota bacterium]MDD3988161.1 PKD domain-containing protein [Candidatus Omnitrophota bacterium]MDD4981904.1 PKD domain-containing protein [Candidatus Omnitrophota bacterium]MDD5665067.1 PKD domain-containing protein [Candidatus Omnitrophota bacterium]